MDILAISGSFGTIPSGPNNWFHVLHCIISHTTMQHELTHAMATPRPVTYTHTHTHKHTHTHTHTCSHFNLHLFPKISSRIQFPTATNPPIGAKSPNPFHSTILHWLRNNQEGVPPDPLLPRPLLSQPVHCFKPWKRIPKDAKTARKDSLGSPEMREWNEANANHSKAIRMPNPLLIEFQDSKSSKTHEEPRTGNWLPAKDSNPTRWWSKRPGAAGRSETMHCFPTPPRVYLLFICCLFVVYTIQSIRWFVIGFWSCSLERVSTGFCFDPVDVWNPGVTRWNRCKMSSIYIELYRLQPTLHFAVLLTTRTMRKSQKAKTFVSFPFQIK